MAAFLIASLPSHPKSLKAVEYMQKNNFSIRISTNVSLMNFLMLSGGGESRQLGVFEEIEPGKEEVHVFANLTCIPSEIKVEADSTEYSPPIENPVPIECIVKEEDDDSMAEQAEDRNPRLEIATDAVDPVGPMEIPIVAPENPPIDVGQTEEEKVDDYQVDPEEEMNFSLDQVENGAAMNENILLAEEYEFDESDTDMLLNIPLPVSGQGVRAVQAEPALEKVHEPTEEREEQNVLGEMDGVGDDQRMDKGDSVAADELLEPLDDSMLSLYSPHNDELEEDLLEEEAMDYRRNEQNLEEEEEEELIEEQEHEDNKNDESEKEEEGSDEEEEKDEDVGSAGHKDENVQKKKKKSDSVAGKSIDRLLFNCPIKNCASSYSTFEELEEHMEHHQGKLQFFCDACKKSFSSKDAAMAHIHERQKKECCACGRKCPKAYDLCRHLRCHTREKPFVCKTCGKGLSMADSLKKHMLVHTGEKRFTCDVCKKRFGFKHALKRHERVHTGEKPFECSQCDYKCGNSSDMVIHNRTHTGEKPFVCGHCKKRFSQTGDHKRHELTHTGEKPYSCEVCDAKFARSTQLKYHMKKNHK